MSISISTSIFPYRLVLSRKEPVELKVDLINRGDKTVNLTLELLLARQLSLDKSGLKTNLVKKIDNFNPNERQNLSFDIFPKGYVTSGEYHVRVKVFQHDNRFNYVEKEFTKSLSITVSD
ncbi:MAG: hypothetical protein HYW50_00895 [Candidatus Diapherotrites archaeon]|nr:hypothetical protein [Candidatus Diapherotrites archaeon]